MPLTALLIALALLIAPPPTPTPSPAPGPAPSASGEQGQTLLAAAYLGFTPESLAASGYSPSDVAHILATIRTRGSYSLLQAQVNASLRAPAAPGPVASGTSSRQRPAIAQAIRRGERQRVLADAVGDTTTNRRDRLERCIQGAASGLPPEISVACGSATERRQAAAALAAERRASITGHPVPAPYAARLGQLRGSPATMAATAATASTLPAVRGQFSQPPSR